MSKAVVQLLRVALGLFVLWALLTLFEISLYAAGHFLVTLMETIGAMMGQGGASP